MKKMKSLKPFVIIFVIALTLSFMPVPAYSASETHATFVQDALRNDRMDNGSSVTGGLMTGLYEYPIGGNIVNCVGNTDYFSYGPYEQYESALKFTLPTTTATLTSATLRLKVVHREGNPTATVTMTNDNNWQQTDGVQSTFPNYSAPLELASGQSVTAENGWQDIPLTNLSALDAKIGSSANDVTLVLSGSTILGSYFDYVADDQGDSTSVAQLVLTFAPYVSSVTMPTNGIYTTGENLIYKVNFTDAVNVTGVPYLTLTIGSSTVHAIYQSGNGTNQLTFVYTLAPRDIDTDGVALASNISLGSGTIRDTTGHDATLTFTGSTAAGVRVKSAQTITFENPDAQYFGTSPTLTATSDSTLPVTFTSDTPDVCTISSEGMLTFLKAGTATISANQAGNNEYAPAVTVSRSFNVIAVPPGAPSIGPATAGDTQASVRFTAPASNGGAEITGYTVTASPGGLSVTGASSPIVITGLTNGVSYTFTVTAINSAGTSAASAPSNSVIPKAPQTITFDNPGAQNFGTHPTLTATSDSTLPVTFTSDTPDVCTVTSDGVLTFLKAGTATISANQAGCDSYLPAETVSQSFTVNAVAPGAPTISAAAAGNGRATVSFSPSAFTGGADTTDYTVTSSPGGFTASGTSSPIVVTGLTNGVSYTFTVTAINSAGTSIASAPSNSVRPKAPQTITFANPGAQYFGTHPTLTATSNSTLPVTFTSDTPDVCTVTSDGVLTFLKAGTATINADQAGSDSYLPAETVSQSFTVNAVAPGAPVIGTVTAGDGRATVSFMPPASNGGADITGYTVMSSPGGLTASGMASPIIVSGLTNGEVYTFTVSATNSAGTGASSLASNSVAPAIPTYTITASAGSGASISPSGTVSVTEGSNRTFTIIPDANYNIASVRVDGVNQGAIGSYTFDNVTANHTITVTATRKATQNPSATPPTTATQTPTPTATVAPTATTAPLTPAPSAAVTPTDSAAAGTRTIMGALLDSDGNPMAGYMVELHSNPMTTVTDANGCYAFYDVDYTSHKLIVKTAEGEKIAEFELVFSEGAEFSTDTTEKGASITYTRSMETVNIEVKLLPGQSGAAISQVYGSEKPQTNDFVGGVGSVLLWIGGGVLAVMLVAILIIILQKKKKEDHKELI